MVICSFHFKGLSANVQVYIATCNPVQHVMKSNVIARKKNSLNIEKIYSIFFRKEQYKFQCYLKDQNSRLLKDCLGGEEGYSPKFKNIYRSCNFLLQIA